MSGNREKASKEICERLMERVADVVSNGVLTNEDAVEILNVCIRACEREVAEIDEITKPDCGVVQ